MTGWTRTRLRFSFWLGAVCVLVGLQSPAQAQSRFSYSPDGSEVTDSRTGLVWRRCSAGQVWSGTACTGPVAGYVHEDALVFAQLQTGWRLPNVKELASITDLTRQNPAIDLLAFPGTAGGCYWSSSPAVGVAGAAWEVDFFNGDVFAQSRRAYCDLRLVR